MFYSYFYADYIRAKNFLEEQRYCKKKDFAKKLKKIKKNKKKRK